MSVRPPPICSLLAGAALLMAGCASTGSLPSAGHGQSGGSSGGATTATSAAKADPPAAGAASAGNGTAGSGTTGGGTAGAAASGPEGPGQTSDERRAAIDKQLSDSLGSFDSELRGEQQRVAQERDTRRAKAGTATSDGQSSDKGGDSAGSAATELPGDSDRPNGTPRRGDASRRRDSSGDLKSEKASKKPDDNAGNGATAREIPDGSDDDVVARRLRQAAEQETDPELKEKLWQEYIDYKRNAQGK